MGLFTRNKSELKDFVETIAKGLVDNPGDVDVQEVEDDSKTVYELRVGNGDLGKVIGKQGQTAKAMRTLLTAASARQGKRAVLEILE